MKKEISLVVILAIVIMGAFLFLDSVPEIKYKVIIYEELSFLRIINLSDKTITGISIVLNNEYTYTPNERENPKDKSKISPYEVSGREISVSCIGTYDFNSFVNSSGVRFDYNKIKPLSLVIKSNEGIGNITSFEYVRE